MSGVYIQAPRNWTQELIHKMIQSVVHLKYYIPRRDRQDGFQTEYNNTKITFYPNGIDFGIDEGEPGYIKQIKWELHYDVDAIVPKVINVTPLDRDVRERLGPVLRHWLDTTE